MSPARRTRSVRKRKQTRKWAITASIPLLIISLVAIVYFWHPANAPEVNEQNVPEGLQTLSNHYLSVMHNLNSSETKAQMESLINHSYNQTELFTWEQSKLTFTQDTTGWYEDPIQILNNGKGICVQYSIVYVSACLAQGYQSRLVVAIDTSSWSYIHVWAEDYYNGSWVHVDPSDSLWNYPQKYQSWDWGAGLGSDVKVYAFEDGDYHEVTSTYSA
jgi:hypothetical protein